MVFSSSTFVFAFLPLFLLIYFALRPGLRNAFILVASLAFYYIGDSTGMFVLIGAILLNYTIGLLLGPAAPLTGQARGAGWRKGWLVSGIITNLSVMVWFKYIGFFTQTINDVVGRLGQPALVPVVQVALPLGISFFMFQGISYIIDVYRGVIAPTRSLVVFGAYKAMFPQLIAGPIVRYHDVAESLEHRSVQTSMVFQGVVRFLIGFGKKVLLADTFAGTADAIFALPSTDLTTSTAWLGALAYTLQIYFDFSAYSDMAIGIAMMMGFRFPENFNYPYTSQSIKEFWRRWHMTLSAWFRDYVYIPLGGSRLGSGRTYLNLVIVWMLTGLWHGAAWTFVAWGMWHGGFIIVERLVKVDRLPIPAVVRWVGTMGVVIVGWVLFRAESFGHAASMVLTMAGLGDTSGRPFLEFWSPWLGLMGLAGLILCFPVYPWIKAHLSVRGRVALGTTFFSAVFAIAGAKVLAGAYSPFLYFRF